MKPKTQSSGQFELFQSNFNQILNLDHELCQRTHAIDWNRFDRELADCYTRVQALHSNPYDGHTLGDALRQVQRITATQNEPLFQGRLSNCKGSRFLF